MRWLWIFLAFLVIGTVAVKAQIFNLEDEDKLDIKPVAKTTGRKRIPSAPILAPAAELPEDKEDTEKLNKLYGEIVKNLKANRVDEAVKLIDGHDVITKEKLVNRLLKENPEDFTVSAGAIPRGTASEQSDSGL